MAYMQRNLKLFSINMFERAVPACSLPRARVRRAASIWLGALAVALMALVAPQLAQHAFAQAGITSPGAGSTISGDVPIFGTADTDSFQKYELHYKLEPSGDDGFVYFDGNTTPVTNGQLGIWRAAALPPGTYSLRLRVVKQDGNYAEFFAPNLTVNMGPPPTPTPSGPTETPTPSTPTPTFTPAPSATPIVGAVQQPQLDQPAMPTPTPAAVAAAPVDPNAAPAVPAGDLAAGQASAAVVAGPAEVTEGSSATRQLGEALALDRLRSEFYRGMRISAAIFLVAVALYAGKRTFTWARRRYG